jgi:hypothetical protein
MRARLTLAIPCVFLLSIATGCATTSTGDSVIRLRPKADPVTGAPPGDWAGQFEFLFAIPDLDPAGTVEFKNADSIGFRVSARPSNWYIAPEVGYLNTEEQVGTAKLEGNEFFGGARLGARFNELPVELYGSGGLSYLDSDVAGIDDETSGYYVGGGVNLYLGSEEGFTLGAGYRLVDHDWDLEEWGEFQVHIGLAW